jgi:hypothetical protein
VSTATTLVDRVRHRLASSGTPVSHSAVAAAVRAESDGVLGDLQVLAALRELQQELVGAGPLEPLLADPDTTDVLSADPTRYGSSSAASCAAPRCASRIPRRSAGWPSGWR